MGKYTVVQPVSYMHEGAAVHQTDREVGTVVDLDDKQAAPLVEAGALTPAEPSPEAATDEDTARRSRRKPDDDQSA